MKGSPSPGMTRALMNVGTAADTFAVAEAQREPVAMALPDVERAHRITPAQQLGVSLREG